PVLSGGGSARACLVAAERGTSILAGLGRGSAAIPGGATGPDGECSPCRSRRELDSVSSVNGFLGADTAQLRETSALFSQRTDLLQETARHTLQLAQRVAWVGPDADGFRAESAALADRLMHIASQVGEKGATQIDHTIQMDET